MDDERIDERCIEATLALHARAYALLLFIGDEARTAPEWLSEASEAALVVPTLCAAWLDARRDAIPPALLGPRADERALAAMLGSFFRTSFHVERLVFHGALVDAVLTRGASRAGTKAVKRRRHGGTPELEALHRLCRDEGVRVPPEARSRIARDAMHADDLVLFTYAVGLVERARGASEGERDVRRFRSLPERWSLDAPRVVAARARLLDALRAAAS